MKVTLKKLRRAGVLILPTATGSVKWSKVGETQEIPDAEAHAMIGKYPDMLAAAAAPRVRKKVITKADPEVAEKTVSEKTVIENKKQAADYANKVL